MTDDNHLMFIGGAAKAVGVAASALRYYEKEGLVAPSTHSRAGYRMYDARDLDRLWFIRSAQAVGFTLDDIRTLLELDPNDPNACQGEVRQLVEQRLAELDEKLKNLKRVRATLGRALDRCLRTSGECPVLKEMSPNIRKRRRR